MKKDFNGEIKTLTVGQRPYRSYFFNIRQELWFK